jgi:chemotaxis family two-component system sensor kinase Cph1
MPEFFGQLFGVDGFTPRWRCGLWTAEHGWLHIISDVAIFGAYFAIPAVIGFYLLRRRDVPFQPLFWLFGAFILSCGLGHLIEASLFWRPWYRLSGVSKAITAVVSWATVFALVRVTPMALRLPGLARVNAALEAEVAQREHAEAELRATNAQLQAVNDQLREFTQAASHDLQAPLRKIEGLVDLLVDDHGDALPDSARQDLEVVRQSAHRMSTLVRDLLALARVGQQTLELEAVPLREAVDLALDALHGDVERAEAQIEIGDLPTIEASRTLVTQLFQNLISNALKYRDDAPPRIEVFAEQVDGRWWITVRDHGMGFDPALAHDAFQPFRRLVPSDATSGSGVGLALCQRAVTRHGGAIEVDTAPGEGAAFRFTLQAPDDA